MKIEQKEHQLSLQLTPKAVIFMALGGFKNPDAKAKATEVEEALKAYMIRHEKEIVLCNDAGQRSIRFLGKNE